MKYKRLILAVSLSAFTLVSTGQEKNDEKMNIDSEIDSVSYSLGVNIAQQLKMQGLDVANPDIIAAGMRDVFEGNNLKIEAQQCQSIIQQFATKAQQAKAEKKKADGLAFLEENGKKKGITTTASGLQYEVLQKGDGGAKPGPENNVTAHYHGTLLDGTVFDSSVKRNQPFKTKVTNVIKAWQEALQLMSPGTKLRIYCPWDIAYGERGAGGSIGPYEVLIFEMELISIDD